MVAISKLGKLAPMKVLVSELNQFQRHLFQFLNFQGAAILNNCDCFKNKSLKTIWPIIACDKKINIIQDGGAQVI